MLAKRIIPCLDVKDGRVVKGVSFVNLRDAGDPVEQAIVYDAEGADELVFLDITASHERRDIVIEMVRSVAQAVFIPFTVGGGIRTVEDMRSILLAGADKTSINSAAVQTLSSSPMAHASLAANASSSPSTPSAGPQAVGRFSSTVAASPRIWMRSMGPARG